MATRERRADSGARHARHLISELGRELREARLAAGLSQESVGKAVGRTGAHVSRIERARLGRVGLIDLAQLASVLGLDLAVRLYPASAPLRDAAHQLLLARLRARLHPSLGWRTEVPLPIPGDRRAWDAAIRIGDVVIGVESETRLSDSQALARRLALKRRDGGVDGVVLLIADTRHNRAALLAAREALRTDLPLDTRAVLAWLGTGRIPTASGIVVL